MLRKKPANTLAQLRSQLEAVAAENEAGLDRLDELEAAHQTAERGRSTSFQRARLSAATSNGTRRVAFHEAGHAVAAYLEGVEVFVVGLKFDSRSDFHGEGGCKHAGPNSAFLSLAGIAAEHVARSRGVIKEVSEDSCWRSDRVTAYSVLPIDADLNRELAHTIDRLRPYWRALNALAERLTSDLEVDGANVRAVIRDALSPEMEN